MSACVLLFVVILLPLITVAAEAEPRFSLQYEVKVDVAPSEMLNVGPQTYLWRYEVLASEILRETVSELERILKYQAKSRLQVNLVTRSRFVEKTGHLGWSSGMYLKGEMYLPIARRSDFSEYKLRRTLRHEYMHSAIAELSDSRSPAWIEEGLAQLFEGEALEKLTPALRDAVIFGNAPQLSDVERSFIRLSRENAAVAYAKSLFAVRHLVNSHGFKAFRRYFSLLKTTKDQERAFLTAFKCSRGEFGVKIERQLHLWSRTDSWL